MKAPVNAALVEAVKTAEKSRAAWSLKFYSPEEPKRFVFNKGYICMDLDGVEKIIQRRVEPGFH